MKLSNLDMRLDASYHLPIADAIAKHLRKHAGELLNVGNSKISKSIIPLPLLKDKSVQNKINSLALEANALRYEAYNLEQEALKIMNDEVISGVNY